MLLRALVALLIAATAGGAAAPTTPPIVFAADDAPALSGEIYRLDADGRLVDLSQSPFEDGAAVVSPDGRNVAFESARGGGGVYVAAVDGSGVQRLAAPPLGPLSDSIPPPLAWAPDGSRLAFASGEPRDAQLSIIGPDRAPLVLAHRLVAFPRWSPDGRLVTALVNGAVRAWYARGGAAWSARVSDAFYTAWSRRGLIVTILHGRVRILDERGRLRLAFPGRAATWSPDGRRLASIAGGRLEVRTSTGLVVFRKTLRGLAHQRTNIVWVGTRRVALLVAERTTLVDLRSGRARRVPERYMRERSPDGRFVAETVRRGEQFEVRLVGIDGSPTRTYGLVPGCRDDGAVVPGLESLQFVPGRQSLVFESYCPEPPLDLYAAAPDGTALSRLTGDGKYHATPRRSPDGTRLVYARFDYGGLSCKGCPGSLWTAGADGSDPRLLVAGDEARSESALFPSWSPDGTRILFSRSSATQQAALFVVPAAGGTPTDLHVAGFETAWGPTRIAWTDIETSPTSLWTAAPDGSDRRQVAGGSISSPAWAKDGRLAYLDGLTTAVVVAGGVERPVPLPFAAVRSIGWSPDGARFVVAARAAGSAAYDVYTLRTDGTDVRRVTTDVNAFSADWR